MRDGTSTDEGTKSVGLSPLRLRVGVFLILLWLVPFWALGPTIAHSLSAVSNPPSVAAVTTTIVVVQTILGLLGFWVAGTEVKSIIKGSTMRLPSGRSGQCSFMGISEVTASIRMTGDHHARTPSAAGALDDGRWPLATDPAGLHEPDSTHQRSAERRHCRTKYGQHEQGDQERDH
jgi:hypothetical protein